MDEGATDAAVMACTLIGVHGVNAVNIAERAVDKARRLGSHRRGLG
jgi:hypothetical protein